MKSIFTEKTEHFIITGLLASDRMKLFLRVEFVPPPPPPPAEKKEEISEEKSIAEKEQKNPTEGKSPAPEVEEKPAPTPVTPRPPLTRQQLLSFIEPHIKSEKIHTGVLDDIVKEVNQGREVSKERRIIVGVAPTPGRDGKLLLLKRPFSGEVEVSINSVGTADFTRLNLFENIVSGDIVARLYPPHPGAEGVDAMGKVLKAVPGKPVKVNIDQSLRIEETSGEERYENIIASTEGYLFQDGNRLSVKDELSIRGDLDLRYGSLDFIGRIIVGGDVAPGISITAKKGIEVRGSVMGGNLVSPEGPIVVSKGVYGTGSTVVLTGSYFEAAIVNRITVEATGDIIIIREARESQLYSGSAVILKNGAILGGHIKTVRGVLAETIGSEGGINTHIHLCTGQESSLQFSKILLDIESHEQILKLLHIHLGPYAENRKRIEMLNKEYAQKMEKFLNKLDRVEASLSELKKRKAAMQQSSGLHPDTGVSIMTKGWEGMVVTAREAEMKIRDSLSGPLTITYCETSESLKLSDFHEIEPEESVQNDG